MGFISVCVTLVGFAVLIAALVVGIFLCLVTLFPSLGEQSDGDDPRTIEEKRQDASSTSDWNVQKMQAHQNHGAYWSTWQDDYSNTACVSNKNLLY